MRGPLFVVVALKPSTQPDPPSTICAAIVADARGEGVRGESASRDIAVGEARQLRAILLRHGLVWPVGIELVGAEARRRPTWRTEFNPKQVETLIR